MRKLLWLTLIPSLCAAGNPQMWYRDGASGVLSLGNPESTFDHDDLGGFVANEHIDVTTWAGSSNLTTIGTLIGELVLDELGVEFQETDSITDCSGFAATGGGIFYDDSEGVFKKCQDNVLTVLDTDNKTVKLGCALSDNTTALTTGTNLCRIPIAAAFTIDTTANSGVACVVATAPTTTTIEVDINEDDGTPASILSTVISIDATENESFDAGTAPVVSDSAIAAGSVLTFDIDQIGSGTAGAGLVCTVIGSFD